MKRICSFLLTIFATATFLSISPICEARIWKDKSGVHEINADFVKLEGRNVIMKLADGTTKNFPLANLAVIDQEHIQTLVAAKKPEAITLSGREIKVVTEGEINTISSGDPMKVVYRRLRATIDLTGGEAAEAYSVGHVLAGPATIDGKKVPAIKASIHKKFNLIDRISEFTLISHPKNGVRIKVDYDVDEGIRKAGDVSGTVRILYGGEPKTVEFTDLGIREEGLLTHPDLEAAGIKVELKREDKNRRKVVKAILTNNFKYVTGVKFMMKDGKKPMMFGGPTSEEEKEVIHEIRISEEELTEEVKLILQFRAGSKEGILPFSVKKIPLE